jgi:broad specificity phosphatase PhoE
MKYNIEWMECINCKTHSYPTSDVSDVGVEDYEEVYEVPSLAQYDKMSAVSEEERKWLDEAEAWVLNYRNEVMNRAEKRLQELIGKVKDVQLVEEDTAIRIIGKRYQAVLEKFDNEWRLKCPNCGYTLIECTW